MALNILTGIRSTGSLHLGNYIGAIQPFAKMVEDHPDSNPFFLIADYHAFTDLARDNSATLSSSRKHLACALSSLNIANAKVFFQSTIPETLELHWLLSSYVPLSLLNRCHAYKAVQDKSKISLSLFSYPVLMSSDILGLQVDVVTVGEDQSQHLEVTNFLAKKTGLPCPKGYIQSSTLVPGTDGRKMSKSYNNTIPIFAEEQEIVSIIMKIPTNSQAAHEPKEPMGCKLFNIYRLLGSAKDIKHLQADYAAGISWREVKMRLIELFLSYFSPYRRTYCMYSKHFHLLEEDLMKNSQLVRQRVIPVLETLKKKLGLASS